MNRLVVRADGGPEIGFGHLVRTSALAEVVIAAGQSVAVATTTPGAAARIFPDDVAIHPLPSRGDPDPFVDLLAEVSADAAFTDSYPVDTDYQRAIRDRLPLTVLQDDGRHAVCADLLVNGNLYAEALDYVFARDEPERCLGPDYALLRASIRDLAGAEPLWRPDPERALVTMGGSDVAGVTPTAVRAFDGFDLTVDAIVGPGVDRDTEWAVREAAAEVDADVAVSRDPEDLPDRMHRADLAVSTASSTTYELLALGTPIVCLPVADNQRPIAGALQKRDAATVLNRGADETAFRRGIRRYVDSPQLRRRRRERGRELVDGRGVERIHAELLSLVDDQSSA